MTVYLIEGADATGKSLLAKAITDSLWYRRPVYIHNTSDDVALPGSLYRHYQAQIRDALNRGGLTVIDRSFLSEYVYGTASPDRKPRISRRQAVRLAKWARKQGVILIGTTASRDDRMARFHERGEAYVAFDDFTAAVYNTFFQDVPTPWFTIDSSSIPSSN